MDSILSLIQSSIKKAALNIDNSETVEIEKIDERLTPNLRALRLAMTIADQLLSMGAAASDVVHMSLGITNTYCSRKVHIDISHTLLTVSQDRGIDREPLTIIRTIVPRYTNYQTIQQLQALAVQARDRKITLSSAEKQLDEIMANPRQYPNWVSHASGGGISAGVSILYGASLTIILLSFGVGVLANLMITRLWKSGVPSFFIQILTAFFVTIFAASLTWLVNQGHIEMLAGINPTYIIVGGIVLLVAGLAIVSAFQDAIDEYYLTASARLLKVGMMTGGIVMGVASGIYFARYMDINLAPTPSRLGLASITYQYIGAAILSASFALGNQARFVGIVLAGANGVLGYYSTLIAMEFGIGMIPAYGIAAAVIGYVSTLISRAWRVPSMATIAAGILPLVPGLLLYNGLMETVQHVPGSAGFNDGTTALLQAFLIALSIAAGASFGNIIGRPVRRKLVQFHNRLPNRRLNRRSAVPAISNDDYTRRS